MAQARLNGIIIDDGGLPCEGRFQYGMTLALGTFTAWQGGALVTGDTFSELVLGLSNGVTYFFQAEARNAVGTTTGAILSFATPGAVGSGDPPEVASLIATALGEHEAQMNGVIINDHGDTCSTQFEYGGTSAYGSKTRWTGGAVTGSAFQEILSILAAGRDCHYRAVAQNSHGIGYGADITFTTRDLGPGSDIPGELMWPLLAEV